MPVISAEVVHMEQPEEDVAKLEAQADLDAEAGDGDAKPKKRRRRLQMRGLITARHAGPKHMRTGWMVSRIGVFRDSFGGGTGFLFGIERIRSKRCRNRNL